ncbi:hypothetical protein QMK19_32700 [Streptomyces sp. H10-C2]|uniref:hypothetical protein n=1 Tax=unclassified Streptomyces TaxID=2593676 RepID=UPI0024B89B9E|nr:MULTISPECIES: hypothetical protein [unclassified Streptomyces]MDJ0345471.1 hypothetical protein [Streptomyces sp. PH10-H1]MDJ0374265.1 hypothetical protein [Streptomyces sp. H10-C2]
MTDRPLLLLDVDGPLNPCTARLTRPRGYTAHVAVQHDAPALLLRISPRRGLREADFAALARWAERL